MHRSILVQTDRSVLDYLPPPSLHVYFGQFCRLLTIRVTYKYNRNRSHYKRRSRIVLFSSFARLSCASPVSDDWNRTFRYLVLPRHDPTEYYYLQQLSGTTPRPQLSCFDIWYSRGTILRSTTPRSSSLARSREHSCTYPFG